MVEYTINFRVATAQMSLDELSSKLGDGGPYSDDRGPEYATGKFRQDTQWVVESGVDRDAPLIEHLEAIAERVPFATLTDISLPPDSEIIVSIAAFFDDAMCTVHFPSQWLELFTASDIGLEVTCYPSDFSG